MITNFKIFENNTDKKIFYRIIKSEDFGIFYKEIKKIKIKTVFFEASDDQENIVAISTMTNDEKIKYFKNMYWSDDYRTSAYMMTNFTPIIDPEKFLKEWKIRKQANKYNL